MSLNKKGFTLLELIVSIVIITAALLTLLQVSATIYSYNLETEIRNEAIKVLESTMSQLKIHKTPPNLVSKTVRGVPVSYTILTQETSVGNVTYVQATALWQYKRVSYQHSMTSVSE